MQSTMMNTPLSLNHLKRGADAQPAALNDHLLKYSFAKWQLPER